MRILSLSIFIFLLALPLLRAFRDKTKYYQLPFLISITAIGFILPTLVAESISAKNLSDQEFILYTINACLCLLGGYMGYYYSPSKQSKRKSLYSVNRIVFWTTPFMIIGFLISFFLIDASLLGLINEGVYAIYVYFGRLIRPTAMIAICVWLATKRKYALALFILYLIISAKFIFISGRRSEVYFLLITLLFPLFFITGYTPTKKLGIIGATIGALVFLLMPIVREYTREGNYSDLSSISFTPIITDYYSGDRTNEIIEAAINMNIVYENSGYSFGARFINKFTHQFVSTTIFGSEVKRSAKIETFDLRDFRNKDYYSTNYKSYLAHSGFADTFYDFGWLSCVVFFLFARISKILWISAYHHGDFFTKIFYCYFATLICWSIYDSISFIPTKIILGLIVIYFVRYNSKIKKAWAF